MKIIIIGRGSSCLKCTADFVGKHDLVVITNKFIYKGYEEFVSNRADIQFRNGTCQNFTEDEIKTLGLKKIIYSHDNNKYPSYPKYYKGIEVIDPKPPIRHEMRNFGFNPSTGIIAIYYVLKNYDVQELSLVGFDFYSLNNAPYYFSEKEADTNLKYLWKNKYKNNVVNVKSGHDSQKSIEFIKNQIIEYQSVKFNMITISEDFFDFKSNNYTLIENL